MVGASDYDPSSDVTSYLSENLISSLGGSGSEAIIRSPTLIGPFVYENIAAGLTNSDASIHGTNTFSSTEGAPQHRSGYVIGSSVRLSAARSADTLTFKPTKDGTELTGTSADLTIDDDPPQQATSTVAWGTANMDFSAGERLGVSLTSGGSWAPTTADALIWLYVAYSST